MKIIIYHKLFLLWNKSSRTWNYTVLKFVINIIFLNDLKWHLNCVQQTTYFGIGCETSELSPSILLKITKLISCIPLNKPVINYHYLNTYFYPCKFFRYYFNLSYIKCMNSIDSLSIIIIKYFNITLNSNIPFYFIKSITTIVRFSSQYFYKCKGGKQ